MRIGQQTGGIFNGPSLHGQATGSASLKPSTLLSHNDDRNPLEQLQAWRTLDEQARRKAVRWQPDRIPLSVFIDPDENPEMPDILFVALSQWETASLGLVRFQQANSAEAADIHIVWSDETVVGRDYEVGHTNREVSGQWIRRAEITLIRKPIIDRHLDAEGRLARLITTVLHETGHALGLEHSENRQDVMHHRGWKNRALSLNDAKAVQALYRESRLDLQ